MEKSAASAPSFVQVTSPIGVPVSVGTGDVHGAFSSTLASANPVIDSVACSSTSVTVTLIETMAELSSASVAFTVTSYVLPASSSSGLS